MGVVIIPVWTYSHGLRTVRYIGIIQDPTTGEIRQQKPGVPSSVTDIIVPASHNPTPNAFTAVAWDQEGYSSNPQPEIRLYYVDTSGKMHERAFSTKHGFGATWYDGESLTSFTAATYSGIAAVTSIPSPSETPRPERSFSVFYQSRETHHIREIINDHTTSGFRLKPLDSNSRPAVPGTRIAAAREIYYQVLEGDIPKWYIQGVEEHTLPVEQFTYAPGAPISVAGSLSNGNATVATVTTNNSLIVSQYDSDNKKWFPPVEPITVVPGRQVWVTSHPPAQQYIGTNRTIAASEKPDDLQDITLIGFVDTAPAEWKLLQV